jgi:hypothetical protein
MIVVRKSVRSVMRIWVFGEDREIVREVGDVRLERGEYMVFELLECEYENGEVVERESRLSSEL